MSDTIHGQIPIHPLVEEIINTPEFRRLREIKQLGMTYYVYPGATHSRFEHSIGQFMRHLKENQGDEFNITDLDVLMVGVAGLLHDVGHGPFSHMFEDVINSIDDSNCWKHEEMSLKMINKIYTRLQVSFEKYEIFKNELEMIQDMIHFEGVKGPSKMEKLHEKWSKKFEKWNKVFLFEIVSNHCNGIDVDKFDYFQRDAKNLKLKSNFDHLRYIKNSRIIMVDSLPHICLRDIIVTELYELYHVRDQLHRFAYKHKASCAIELMLTEVLQEADKYFDFKGKIRNVNEYVKLDDSIKHQILYATDPRLEKAKQLMKRIEDRRLYKHISRTLILNEELFSKQSLVDAMKYEIISIYNLLRSNASDILQVEDIIILNKTFDYGDGVNNPVEKVRFFAKNDLHNTFMIKGEQVSLMLPQTFQEKVVRLYLKKDIQSDEMKALTIGFLKEAFHQWVDNQNDLHQIKVFSKPI